MVSFVTGTAVKTDTPDVLVDAGLPVGRHRFQLVVMDNGGTRSQPDEIVVQIRRGVVPPVTGPVITGPVVLGPFVPGPVTGPVTGPVVNPPITRPQVVQPIRRKR